MGRPERESPGGWVYHVLNAQMPIFTKDEDFIVFETVLEEAVARTGTQLLSWCLMGNHWHLVLWPREDDELLSAWTLRRNPGWLEHVNDSLRAIWLFVPDPFSEGMPPHPACRPPSPLTLGEKGHGGVAENG